MKVHTLLCFVTSEARANAAKDTLDYVVSGIYNGGESRTTCASSDQHTRWSLRSDENKSACRDHVTICLSCHTNNGINKQHLIQITPLAIFHPLAVTTRLSSWFSAAAALVSASSPSLRQHPVHLSVLRAKATRFKQLLSPLSL